MSELQLESTQAFDEAFDNISNMQNMLEKDTTTEKRLSSPSMLPLGNVNIDKNNNITDSLIQTIRKTSSRADSRNQMHSTATKEPMTQRRSKRTKRQDPEIQSINEETNNSDNNDDNQTEMVTDNEHIEKEKQKQQEQPKTGRKKKANNPNESTNINWSKEELITKFTEKGLKLPFFAPLNEQINHKILPTNKDVEFQKKSFVKLINYI